MQLLKNNFVYLRNISISQSIDKTKIFLYSLIEPGKLDSFFTLLTKVVRTFFGLVFSIINQSSDMSCIRRKVLEEKDAHQSYC